MRELTNRKVFLLPSDRDAEQKFQDSVGVDPIALRAVFVQLFRLGNLDKHRRAGR